MGFLKRLGRSLAGGRQADRDALWVYVRCKRCGEAIAARVSLRNDLSIHYNASGQPAGYHTRKVLVGGTRRCYQPVDVQLTFDAGRRLQNREVSGGEFITAEEYEAAQAAADATADAAESAGRD